MQTSWWVQVMATYILNSLIHITLQIVQVIEVHIKATENKDFFFCCISARVSPDTRLWLNESIWNAIIKYYINFR